VRQNKRTKSFCSRIHCAIQKKEKQFVALRWYFNHREKEKIYKLNKQDLHNEITTCKTALAFYRVPRSREFEKKTHYFTIISEIHLPTLLTNKIVFISPGAVSPGGEKLKGNGRAK
jgi:hypothetical protein